MHATYMHTTHAHTHTIQTSEQEMTHLADLLVLLLQRETLRCASHANSARGEFMYGCFFKRLADTGPGCRLTTAAVIFD